MSDLNGGARLPEMTVSDFLAALASSDPAPGGGSAAALAGALAAALVAMVARVTIGKPRYEAVQEAMVGARDRADALRDQLTALIQADAEAYAAVTAAYRLPREPAEQKAARSDAIQVALRRAAEIPLSTAADCAELLTLLAATAPLGNRNALSDAHVAAHLAQTGLLGAVRNVRQNLEGLADVHLRSQLERRVGSLVREGEAALREIRAAIGTGE